MSAIDAVMAIEDGCESYEDFYSNLQQLINAGQWGLQGSYGRTMMQAIEDGYCVLGREGVRDYYGNYIPARDEVQEGTKGSVEYVSNRQGEEWAEWISAV